MSTRAERRAAQAAAQQQTTLEKPVEQTQEELQNPGADGAELPRADAGAIDAAAGLNVVDGELSQAPADKATADAVANVIDDPKHWTGAPSDQAPSLSQASTVVVEETHPKTVSTSAPPVAQTAEETAAAPVAAAAPVVQTAAAMQTVTTETKAAILVDDFEAALNEIRQTGTVMQKVIVDFFDRYLNIMEPKKRISDSDMFREQMAMWTMFNTILDHSKDEEFDRLWHMLTAIFGRRDVEGSALHDTAIFRGTWMWPEGDRRLQALTNVITLVKATHQQETRAKNLKYIDMEKILTGAFTDRARTRLLKFYGK